MAEFRILEYPTSTDVLCRNDPETLEQFLRCNPQLSQNRGTLPRHSVYSLNPNQNPAYQIIGRELHQLPAASRENLYTCVADFGDQVPTLAEFYQRHLAGLSLADAGQNSNSLAGIGVAATQARLSNFQQALLDYQNALVRLNRNTRTGRGASAARTEARAQVFRAYERMNTLYQQEMKRLVPGHLRTRNRGSALSNAERGITLAERSRGRGIHVADLHEGRRVAKFANSLRYAGQGMIAIDIGFRAGKVGTAYQGQQDWRREMVVQTSGLAGATVGASATRAALLIGRVALAATPMGWALLIGSSIVIGAVAAYQLDKRFQSRAGKIWDEAF